MTDRPIIFSAPMVRALLEAHKTQTRRLIKPQPPEGSSLLALFRGEGQDRHVQFIGPSGSITKSQPVRYAPGDRLWVRESWRTNGDGGRADYLSPSRMQQHSVLYEATREALVLSPDAGKLRPSIHMPRWASRLTLTVTDVRVQRLQEISLVDAVAEGLSAEPLHTENCEPRAAFRELWGSLHGPDAWDANPWVVALTFTIQRGNIDALSSS